MTSITYRLAFAFAWSLSLIPFWLLYRFSDILYLFNFYILRYRKKVVFHNLRTSFPEKTEKDIVRLAKAFYRHFSDFLVEIIKVMSISGKEIHRRMKVINPEVFDELAQNNQNLALVTAHYGNWEWLYIMPEIMKKHLCMIIYRPLKSKISDRISLYMRTRKNAKMVPMDQIFREGIKNRSEKRLFSIWFLADQRPPRNSSFWTTFLNHETAFFEGTEKISRKLGMAVVFMDIQKVRRGYYEARLEKLFDNAAMSREGEVTLTCINKMEEEIIQKPEFWLWSHKRFKHKRPEDVKLVNR